MANPFLYSKIKHSRSLTPPNYVNYRLFKPDLRREFGRQCVYCRALDILKGEQSFAVDHYRPKNLFPHLKTEYLNLFYACNRCNSFKGDFWPLSERLNAGEFVPNPCEHVMFEHLRYQDGTVTAASGAGYWTIALLDLNDPQAVIFRDAYIRCLTLLTTTIQAATNTAAEAKQVLGKATTAAQIAAANVKHQQALVNLAQLEADLKTLLG